jgi:bla regulator protein blaR1
MMIIFAYDVKDFQVSGGPGWANSETYDIVAKGDGNATRPQLRLMLQALLKDRFKLALRQETKDAPIYELVVAKGGLKIQEDTTSPRSRSGMTGPGKFIAQKTSLAMFAQFLGTLAGRPVVDNTGLASTYSFKLDWTPEVGEGGPLGPAPLDAVPPDSNRPSLFTALQEQLGLRLQSAKGPVESLVIEKAEKPTEN